MATGCGGPPAALEADRAEASLAAGDPQAPPTLRALPEVPRESDTTRTHQGLLAAREALLAGIPQPPVDRSYAALKAWSETAVTQWVQTRRQRIEDVRERFDLEEGASVGELIVRHATLGLLHEDTANALSTLPAPAELDTEPKIGAIYREVLAAQAEPFVSAALLSFRDCANLAYRSEAAMTRWADFCHERFDRLKGEALRRQGRLQARAPAQ